MPRLRTSTWVVGAALLAAVPLLSVAPQGRGTWVRLGTPALAHHIGQYRGGCARTVCTKRIIFGICVRKGCGAWHYNHGAHNAWHAADAKRRADAARCEAASVAALKEAQSQLAKANQGRDQAVRLLPIVRKAVLGDLAAAKTAASGAEAALNAARAAAKVTAAQIGKDCGTKRKKAIADAVAAAKTAAAAAEKAGQAAVAAYRSADKAAKVGAALDKYLAGLRSAALELMAAAREMAKRAPAALEAMGGFEGVPQQRFLRAVALIRYRTAQDFRLLKVARSLQAAAFSPLDDKGVSHLVNLQARKEFEQAEDLMQAPVDPDKEVDKELDNLSLRELGVGGEGKDPQRDRANLEFPFDRAKAALAKLVLQGNRYLQATKDTFLSPHQKHAKTLITWFKKIAAEIKGGLRGVILAITNIEKEQAGGDDDE